VRSHDQHTHRLLAEIASNEHLSQRTLSRRLGIALGLTNLLIRRVVRKGWVRVIHIRPNRVMYLVTPTGIAEKARMSRDSLQYSLRFYSEARQRIAARFVTLSQEWPPRVGEEKRIVFFGTGEVAEVGYVCLQETDLRLIGAIDDHGRNRFFDVPLYPGDWLKQDSRDPLAFGRLVVMSFENRDAIAGRLARLGVPEDRVFWI
jgi:DNA-binding MarR family transcriptional regulator